MSKFIMLGDVHIGARNSSPVVAQFQINFLVEQLIPYMLKKGIDTILQLGDLFDNRKQTNHTIIHMWKEGFFDVLKSNGIKMITILGNHDIFHRNTLKINSPELFLKEYDNITIINSVTEHDFYGTKFLLVPWICMENEEEVFKVIEKTEAIYCAGHFEFDGFEMHRGQIAHGGLPVGDFDKFDCVYSGHYHTRSTKKNICYVGTPAEMTWVDYNDPKGFHVFDTKKGKHTFIENEDTLFYRLEYDDKNIEPTNYTGLTDCYVKVVTINKTDPVKFENYIAKIVAQTPADLKITDIDNSFDDIELDDEEIDLEDTNTLIIKFVDQLDTELDKDVIKGILQSLYVDALEVVI